MQVHCMLRLAALQRCCRGAMLALFVVAYVDAVGASSPAKWRETSERIREQMTVMDEVIRDTDAERSYETYLAMFAKDVRANGIYEGRPADHAGLREHYRPVFFELRDGVLLSDEVIVAGRMAAQRYHSMLYLHGKFDDVEASGRPVFLRGQTFFRFDDNLRIVERWSNHDHAFRLKQLKGAVGAEEGERLAKALNGPGPGEMVVREWLAAMNRAFNRIDLPAERESTFLGFFAPKVNVHGLADEVLDRDGLQRYLRELWAAFPDLERIDEARLSAWSMGAVKWRALGSHRGSYRGIKPTQRPARVRGESIFRFDADGEIVEAWMNVAPIQID